MGRGPLFDSLGEQGWERVSETVCTIGLIPASYYGIAGEAAQALAIRWTFKRPRVAD